MGFAEENKRVFMVVWRLLIQVNNTRFMEIWEKKTGSYWCCGEIFLGKFMEDNMEIIGRKNSILVQGQDKCGNITRKLKIRKISREKWILLV